MTWNYIKNTELGTNDDYLPEFPQLILSDMMIIISLPEWFGIQNYFHWGMVSFFAFWSFHLNLQGPAGSVLWNLWTWGHRTWPWEVKLLLYFQYWYLLDISLAMHGVWVLVLLVLVHCATDGHPRLIKKNTCMFIYNKWNMSLKVHWLTKRNIYDHVL